MNMQSKLPSVATNIFSVMSSMANEYNATNLSQGFPDYPISPVLIDAVSKAMKDGFNQYAPMIGLQSLRNALASKVEKLYGNAINPDEEITITPGATYAIYTAFTTILHKGDEVIVLEPAYDSYIPNIELNGAKAICIPLQYPAFSVDWQKVKNTITAKTKAIIINSPHNPTGYVWTKNDMDELANVVRDTNMYIVSDEVYEHLTLDERKHESVLKYPDLYKRSFVTFSFGKVFHATGWKMGYCIAPKELTNEFRKIHQFLSFTTNTPMQVGLAHFLQNENEYLSLSSFFQKKRNLFLELIKELPFTIHQPTQGSYFQLASYEKISELSDKQFAIWLTKEFGVATIPVSAFYRNGNDEKLVRFCFAKKDETLIEAMQKLTKLI